MVEGGGRARMSQAKNLLLSLPVSAQSIGEVRREAEGRHCGGGHFKDARQRVSVTVLVHRDLARVRDGLGQMAVALMCVHLHCLGLHCLGLSRLALCLGRGHSVGPAWCYLALSHRSGGRRRRRRDSGCRLGRSGGICRVSILPRLGILPESARGQFPVAFFVCCAAEQGKLDDGAKRLDDLNACDAVPLGDIVPRKELFAGLCDIDNEVWRVLLWLGWR